MDRKSFIAGIRFETFQIPVHSVSGRCSPLLSPATVTSNDTESHHLGQGCCSHRCSGRVYSPGPTQNPPARPARWLAWARITTIL
jgi:hypothetical protein